jgi:sugar phosphate isomerase/epimerase
MNRLGCSTLAFARFDLDTSLKAIADLGFPVIDLAVIEGVAEHYDPVGKSRADYQGLAKKIRSYGLSVSTLNVNAGDYNDPQTRDKHFTKVKAALDCAAALGCCGVTTKAGNYGNGDWEAQAKDSIRRIREVADHAHALKLKLSLEIPHTATLAVSLEQAVRFFEMVLHTSVDVTLDTSHLYACKADFR